MLNLLHYGFEQESRADILTFPECSATEKTKTNTKTKTKTKTKQNKTTNKKPNQKKTKTKTNKQTCNCEHLDVLGFKIQC